MKKYQLFFYLSMVLLVLLAACAPASTPTAVVIQVTATSPATEAPSATTAPAEAPSPTAVPITLAGPPMQVGSTFLYFDGTTLVAVPGGPFTMGHGGSDNPIHTVTVGDFWIYSTKVTNQEYAECVKQGKCSTPDLNDNQGYTDPLRLNDPVVGVNWTQSQDYCTYAHGFLPTEAQWEKTARGPDANIYPWGNNQPACDLLNFNNCVGKTTMVTTYPKGQSYYKALDMEGNSYEWVADWYDALFYKTGPAQDPLGPNSGNERSIRSSSYHSNNDQAPASTRFFANPTDHRRDLGFRCVVTAPTFFAPMCQFPGYVGPNLSGGAGSLTITKDCPNLTANAAQLQCGSGQTNITFTDDHPSDPNVSFNAPGCTQFSDSVIAGKRVVQFNCINQYGTATVTSKCTYTGTSTPVCPAHYNLDTTTGVCTWDGSGTEGTACPAGYQFDPTMKCCTSTAGIGTNFSACPAGSAFTDLGGGMYACMDSGILGDAAPANADETPPSDCGSHNACPTTDPNYPTCQPGGGNNPVCPPNTTWDGRCCLNINKQCVTYLCLPAGTMIDTPNGAVAVQDFKVGDPVWSASTTGERFLATVLKVVRTPVPADHQMATVVLADGREVYASIGHPTADGRTLGDLRPGDLLDGSAVVSVTRGPYNQPATYDLLPSGGTGFYWANGILLGSTLTNP